jgi:hypothetical protein
MNDLAEINTSKNFKEGVMDKTNIVKDPIKVASQLIRDNLLAQSNQDIQIDFEAKKSTKIMTRSSSNYQVTKDKLSEKIAKGQVINFSKKALQKMSIKFPKNKGKAVQENLQLPAMAETIGLINSLIRHQPENSKKRGRKRHNIYRKSLWYKSFPRNVY